jgi:hypothetical protein
MTMTIHGPKDDIAYAKLCASGVEPIVRGQGTRPSPRGIRPHRHGAPRGSGRGFRRAHRADGQATKHGYGRSASSLTVNQQRSQ